MPRAVNMIVWRGRIMSVSLIKSEALAVHIHVGHNIPGYLPESDVMCFDSVTDALDALRHEIDDQQDYYYDQCGDGTPEGCGCAWCDVATDAEAALSAIANGDAAHVMRTQDCAAWIFSPPEGADIRHWAIKVADIREDCEIFAEQEGCEVVGDAGTGHGSYEYHSEA
jgi:hypothetical protein